MINRIASFSADHDLIVPGMYISRIDGDISTYDLRTRTPNSGDYMDNLTMHSLEHMFATFVRNGALSDKVIYFGPMGCQTGFYLLMRTMDHKAVYLEICKVLENIINYTGEMFGNKQKECGNFRNLNVSAAQLEAKRYLDVLKNYTEKDMSFTYPV